MPLTSGQILHQRYHILRQIDQGGMGAVYEAEDQALHTRCAIKEMIPDPQAGAEVLAQLRRQFEREAQVLAQLRHPNLPRVTDFFVEQGNQYLVMDLVVGDSLEDLVNRQGALPEADVRRWAHQLLDALDYCHGNGIIHRDVKPANVILRADGQVSLVDFGLVKPYDPANPQTAFAMRGLATPHYAPLEQYAGIDAHTDARSDLYSLGATLYHLLTGTVPADAHQRFLNPDALTPPRQHNPRVSPGMQQVVLKAMAMHPDQRYPSAAAMRQALGRPRRRSRRLAGWLAGAAITVVALAVALLLLSQKLPLPLGELAERAATTSLSTTTVQEAAVATHTPPLPTSTLAAAISIPAPPSTIASTSSMPSPISSEAGLTPTVVPSPTPTPRPATSTPAPSPTATSTPSATPTPMSTATPLPTEEPTRTPTAPPTPAKPGVVLDFESFGAWQRGDEPYGTLAQSGERSRRGSYAAKLTYDIPPAQNNYVVFLKTPPLPIPGQPDALSLWVYGDGSGHYLNVWIRDSQGEVRQFSFGQVEHTDQWQSMTVELDNTAPWPQGHISGPDNGQLDYPISLYALVFDAVPRNDVAYRGQIYLDELTVGRGATAGAQPTATPQVAATSLPAATPGAEQPSPGALAGTIVYAAANGNTTDVMALDVSTGNTWPLFSSARQPDLRDDGRVVFDGIGAGRLNLFTIYTDGSRQMMTGLHPEDSYPHWSPSGLSLVFYSTLQGDGRERIYIQWDMTHAEEPAPLKVGMQDVFGRYPTWMKTWRVAFSGCDYWAGGSHCGIWTVDSNGNGNPIQLTERLDDRSTDSHGGMLLFSSQVEGNWEVYIVSGSGGAPRNLTNSPGQEAAATFSPDGQHIAFISDRDGGWGIWVMNADGSAARKLLAAPNGLGANWMEERLAWGP